MMNKMRYGDILAIEWQLNRRVSLLKRQFEEVMHYGKGAVLYDIALGDLTEARESEKMIRAIWETVKESNIEEVYSN